ncbi:helix-turn-helix transcriptional regulator [Pararhizobium mangrovi]|uniref:Helix-turn-helix domain-containing protein n=1 Tax=Pararhizobium mangrovi TaxID=2590452 RepID=A0A506UCC5_9HYPH|nr:helix-turn-helix transcriptional regulator [Pararhizobium mangrovi]TPW31248.1 helix-turn-helix domain-containing protein [Pararhizobium mangrovi]
MTEPAPHPTPDRARDLADFVRACRERLTPQAIGLPVTPRRRTPGLRREEVAQLSGLSTTWYTWLEQARDVAVSAAALDRLARALRLQRAERAYLFELAGRHDPAGQAAMQTVESALPADCLEHIDVPAYVLDRYWSARHWNRPAADLFVGWLDEETPGNLLRYIFCTPAARALIRNFEERARRIVAEFRADVGTGIEDAAIRTLIEELTQDSPLFARLWREHAVVEREGGERLFDHPIHGALGYEQVTFDVAGRPGFKLTMLLPRT